MTLTHADFAPYQRKAENFLLSNNRAALLLDMGMGKTAICLAVLRALQIYGELGPVLIVSTIRVCRGVWRQEGKVWEFAKGLRFSLVVGNDQERRDALNKPADIYLTNFESIPWLFGRKKKPKRDDAGNIIVKRDKFGKEIIKPRVIRPNFRHIIVDESSQLKDSQTERWRALRKVLPEFERVWILTGTPAPKGLLNLWAQIYLLDGGRALGVTYQHYRRTYFSKEDEYGYKYVIRDRRAEREIYERIGPMVMRLDAADYNLMPKRLPDNVINIAMPASARALYNKFEREMFLELEGLEVEAINAAIVTAKCWQMANGFLKSSESDEWRLIHDLKLDALEAMLEESDGNPVLVPYWFKADLERLQKRFDRTTYCDRRPLEVMTNTNTEVMLPRWNAGGIPVLAMHWKTGAHGMNMQHGGHQIFGFSQTWSTELWLQYIARLARQGQKIPVRVTVPVVTGTTDEVMRDVVINDIRTQDGFLQAMKRYRDYKELT